MHVPKSSPYIINLKQNPFERIIHARGNDEWAKKNLRRMATVAITSGDVLKGVLDE